MPFSYPRRNKRIVWFAAKVYIALQAKLHFANIEFANLISVSSQLACEGVRNHSPALFASIPLSSFSNATGYFKHLSFFPKKCQRYICVPNPCEFHPFYSTTYAKIAENYRPIFL